MMENKSGIGGCLIALLCSACATPERVVLLPEADGTPSAVVVRARQGGELVLDQPYAMARIERARVTAEASDAASVTKRYRAVIDALPVKARSYTLNFEFGKTQLTSESRNLLDRILLEMRELPAPEMILVGHTDDVGSDAANDRLSLERANQVLALIKARGIVLNDVTVVGRGKRDPLHSGKSGVPEPRNRRVEIRIK